MENNMETKKKKVAIMGLESLNNYGENFIIRCVNYLVRDFGFDSTIVDFEPKMNLIKKCCYYFVLVISKMMPIKHMKYKIMYLAVKIRCSSFYNKSLKEADALIFGAGSFKYGTQKLWCYYSLAVEIADKYNIPVMFNAMNVQNYKEDDWRCKFLTKHANYECVKIITSRDGKHGADRLKNDYKLSPRIICGGVGDVAFWIPDCYQIGKEIHTDTVGINIINGNTFRRYNKSLTEEQLLSIYQELLILLDKNNIKWELYTNGLDIDYQFGKKLLLKYGNTNIEIKVPHSDKELIQLICGYKKILGARLHSCICAYAIGKPFVGFIWDEKLFYFSKMASIYQCFVEEEELSGELLYKKLSSHEIELTEEQINIREAWKYKTKEYIDKFLKEYM